MKRYAIYVAPREGALATATAAWLGWDPAEGAEVGCPERFGFDWEAVTKAPGKYGFHGTLKAPFRLADGYNYEELRRATDKLASDLRPITVQRMQLSGVSDFLALVPDGETPELGECAATVVRALDRFRAPPTPADAARRGLEDLTDRQRQQFWDFGYPFIFDDFRFHMTLSGKLAAEVRPEVIAALGRLVAPLVPSPFLIEDLCLFGEGEDSRFRILHRSALCG